MRRALTICAALLALAAPSAAEGATATTADGNLRFTALAGEVNNVSFARVSGDAFRVTDVGAPVTAGTGCTQESPNVATCTTQPGRPIIANLGDQNDRATSRTSTCRNANVAPQFRARRSIFGMSPSLSPGIVGASETPTGTPAFASASTAWKRPLPY